MTIKYAFTPDGGFVCGDTETGVTCGRSAGSPDARWAKRNAKKAARRLLEGESKRDEYVTPKLAREIDRLNWERLGGREERKDG